MMPMSTSTAADLWPEIEPEAARRLLIAGVESFARRGFHATTTRHIASGAGMSPAALYVHFPSKAALLYEIARRGHELTLEMVRKAASRGTDPVERLRALVEEFTSWHAERHMVARVIQYELKALPKDGFEVVAGLRRRCVQVVRDLIEEGVAAGAFKVSDVRTASRAVLSLGIDVARWYHDRSPESPRQLGREYAALALRMLGAPGV